MGVERSFSRRLLVEEKIMVMTLNATFGSQSSSSTFFILPSLSRRSLVRRRINASFAAQQFLRLVEGNTAITLV
jgi:hypothetical protein